MPVVPTQYDMSTIRESSSSSAKSGRDMFVCRSKDEEEGCCALVVGVLVATPRKHKVKTVKMVACRIVCRCNHIFAGR